MRNISLVTGANGLLGNTLVRELLARGEKVRGSVRDVRDLTPFAGLDCEIVGADMLDKPSLLKAMHEVDTLYHVAAVFKHWAENPQKEIIDANLAGTRNVLEAAAERGVRKVIYVSSIAALDHSKVPMNENTWGTHFPNPYYFSKNQSEKLAWELAQNLGLWLVSILPSGIIGKNTYRQLSASNGLLNTVVKNRLPFDPDFAFNFVHAEDVARGMVLAAQKGRSGERYILATEPSISTTTVIELARGLFPTLKKPVKVPKAVLMLIAMKMELESRFTHQAPQLLMGNVRHFFRADERMDITKARRELGYSPMLPESAIKDVLKHLAKTEF